MRRFRFALAKLHRVRAQQEKLARRGLGAALADLRALENRLADVRSGIEACNGERGSSAQGLAQAVEDGLRRSEAALLRQQDQAQKNVELARQMYFARRRDLRSIEKLHEARQSEWREECQREEQMEIEEMTRAASVRARFEEARQ